MKSVIVRLNPITQTPVLFDANSASSGQIDAIISGQKKRVGISDYYAKSLPLSRQDAMTVAKLYAQQENIPEDELILRDRLPKTPNKRPARLNDANLVLVPSEKAEQPKQQASAPSTLTELAQALVDEHNTNRRKEDKPEGQQASAEQPEGAVVERTKRKYHKKTEAEKAARSAKSMAAYKRYIEELGRTSAQSPTMMQPVASDAPQPVIDAAVMELATALAKILKGVV